MGGRANPTWDQTQKIRVSLITQPSADGAASQVRVTFQRLVWDNHANVSKIETIDDPKVYQQFFDKLSQSLFLEAQRI
jgi:inosine-uridine nucleoside N-ribohydrolase